MTVVDCKNLERHLDEKKTDGSCNEAQLQVAFADCILMNKQVLTMSAVPMNVCLHFVADGCYSCLCAPDGGTHFRTW